MEYKQILPIQYRTKGESVSIMQDNRIESVVTQNLKRLNTLFSHNELFVTRDLSLPEDLPPVSIAYISVLVDEKTLDQTIVRHVTSIGVPGGGLTAEHLIGLVRNAGATAVLSELNEAARFINDAGVVIFIEGCSEAWGRSLPGYESRQVQEPKLEGNVRGPREGFIEDLQKNLGLVYRRLKTTDLKSVPFQFGQYSQTKVMVLYLEQAVNRSVLREVQERFESVTIETLVDSAQIEELTQDSTFSPFPQILNTERPDRVVTALNRGKVAIMVDGTPNILIAPALITDFLHPSEDLYERFYFANFLRLFRCMTLFISLFGPSLYIAITTFHLQPAFVAASNWNDYS